MKESIEYSKGFALGWDAAVKALAETNNFKSEEYKAVMANVIRFILNNERISNQCFNNLAAIASRINAEISNEIQVGDWVRFKDRHNKPFKVTHCEPEKNSVWGVDEDGFTYAAIYLTEVEKVKS